jgi:hypothetical protein
VAARYSVAAGCAATECLRDSNLGADVSQLDPELVAFFGEQTE